MTILTSLKKVVYVYIITIYYRGSGTQANDHQDIYILSYKGLRWESKFVSKNVINLSRRNQFLPEFSLLSTGLKFMPSANKIDQSKLKRELEEYGRKLHLMWHFRMMNKVLQLINLDTKDSWYIKVFSSSKE